MTKLKELAIHDINNFNSIEMAKIYDFMQFIKEKKHVKASEINTAYLQVREALRGSSSSLSEEILSEREEAI